jgi:hypothetical protein
MARGVQLPIGWLRIILVIWHTLNRHGLPLDDSRSDCIGRGHMGYTKGVFGDEISKLKPFQWMVCVHPLGAPTNPSAFRARRRRQQLHCRTVRGEIEQRGGSGDGDAAQARPYKCVVRFRRSDTATWAWAQGHRGGPTIRRRRSDRPPHSGAPDRGSLLLTQEAY